MVSKETVKNIIKELNKRKKPARTDLTRKEAIEQLKPTIRNLTNKGFGDKEIISLVANLSNNEIKLSTNEIKKIALTQLPCSSSEIKAVIQPEIIHSTNNEQTPETEEVTDSLLMNNDNE